MRALIVGTGYSLRGVSGELHRFDGLIFAPNNTPADLLTAGCDPRQMVWLGNDPKWHDLYSPYPGEFSKWHWSRAICERFGYTFIEGIPPNEQTTSENPHSPYLLGLNRETA